jgi:SAM-dependent methyltransferase
MTPADLPPSAWILRFAPRVPPGPVLDLAAGKGRHAALFLERGHPVTAVDRRIDGLRPLAATHPRLELIEADLESGSGWPLGRRQFTGVVVTNYLHRPLLPAIVTAVAPGGWLLYETFARGNERFGRPSNPDYLLRPGELIDAVRGTLEITAYEAGETDAPAIIQRIAAVKPFGDT